LSVPDEGYSRDVSCALNVISTFLLELADYSNLNRDIDKRILNDLSMSKIVFFF